MANGGDKGFVRRQRSGKETTGAGLAMRLGTEFVVATMIGAGMGHVLDHWLRTGPWCTVVFLFFGAAAGLRNAYRLVQSHSAST
ncbi:MAG: AtpZ/AtpI family protein [Magnetococcales bacterium]|nr:AtpZ/AtpI family protein [Magnetococcales bacterium]